MSESTIRRIVNNLYNLDRKTEAELLFKSMLYCLTHSGIDSLAKTVSMQYPNLTR